MEACCVSLYNRHELLKQKFLKYPKESQVTAVMKEYCRYVNEKVPDIKMWDEERWERNPYSETSVDETEVYKKGDYLVSVAISYIDHSDEE